MYVRFDLVDPHDVKQVLDSGYVVSVSDDSDFDRLLIGWLEKFGFPLYRKGDYAVCVRFAIHR